MKLGWLRRCAATRVRRSAQRLPSGGHAGRGSSGGRRSTSIPSPGPETILKRLIAVLAAFVVAVQQVDGHPLALLDGLRHMSKYVKSSSRVPHALPARSRRRPPGCTGPGTAAGISRAHSTVAGWSGAGQAGPFRPARPPPLEHRDPGAHIAHRPREVDVLVDFFGGGRPHRRPSPSGRRPTATFSAGSWSREPRARGETDLALSSAMRASDWPSAPPNRSRPGARSAPRRPAQARDLDQSAMPRGYAEWFRVGPSR